MFKYFLKSLWYRISLSNTQEYFKFYENGIFFEKMIFMPISAIYNIVHLSNNFFSIFLKRRLFFKHHHNGRFNKSEQDNRWFLKKTRDVSLKFMKKMEQEMSLIFWLTYLIYGIFNSVNGIVFQIAFKWVAFISKLLIFAEFCKSIPYILNNGCNLENIFKCFKIFFVCRRQFLLLSIK